MTTTGPRSGGSRFFASPSRAWHRAPRSHHPRPAHRRVSRKLAPGFFRSDSAPHARQVAAQAADERPACTIFSYQTTSGCAVGPNSVDVALVSRSDNYLGYADPFGNRHVTFCMSCHAPTAEAQFNKQQHVLANALDYKVIAYEQLLGTLLSAGLGVIAEGMTKADAARQLLALNRAGGAAWEGELLSTVLPRTQTNIRPQITVRSNGPSGLSARLDAMGTDANGTIRLSDGKLTPTAPLTPNQTIVYPELEIYGGTVTGAGKAPYTGGTAIPPTAVDILIRPQ